MPVPSWSVIADNEIDPESPVTSELLFKLRDNPLALLGVDPSSPSPTLNLGVRGEIFCTRTSATTVGATGSVTNPSTGVYEWTVPTGITIIEVQICGGGGGGAGRSATTIGGGAGGASTVNGTGSGLLVTANGGAGADGDPTGPGGSGGAASGRCGAGGAGAKGSQGTDGGGGGGCGNTQSTGAHAPGTSTGQTIICRVPGVGAFGGSGGNGASVSHGADATGYGNGGGGGTEIGGNACGGGGGGAGGCFLVAVQSEEVLTLTVGAGGAGGNGSNVDGGDGSPGMIRIRF